MCEWAYAFYYLGAEYLISSYLVIGGTAFEARRNASESLIRLWLSH